MLKSNKKNLICGVLHVSSKVNYGSSKNGIIKKFTAFRKFKFNGNLYKILYVKTKKNFNPRDLYCIIEFIGIDNDIAYGAIREYIGEVGNEQVEMQYIRAICITTWINDKRFKIESYFDDIYYNERTTLENCEIYSIDPIGCIDIDDAIHIKKMDYGYEIGIHISDVSSYIPKNSELDIELSHRCESVYLKNCQINMIPSKLLEKCSLIEQIPKRVISIMIKLDKDYRIVDVKYGHYTVIIKKNLSYEEAQELINDQKIESLNLLYEIGRELYNKENFFLNTELYDVHKMVEIYMILANTITANYVTEINKENVILRCHSGARKNLYKSKEIESQLTDKANILLMSKAEYRCGINNLNEITHIGLNKLLYTHFTSPLRRYIDIIIHRMLCNNDKDNYYELVNYINETHNLYKKCEKLSFEINKIYQLLNDYGDIIETHGNIIDIDEEKYKVKIYIKEFDLIADSFLFSKKLSDLLDISKKKVDDLEIIKIKSKINNKKISLKMFQYVEVKIAIVLSMKYKLLTRIVNPNIMSLFDTNSLDQNINNMNNMS